MSGILEETRRITRGKIKFSEGNCTITTLFSLCGPLHASREHYERCTRFGRLTALDTISGTAWSAAASSSIWMASLRNFRRRGSTLAAIDCRSSMPTARSGFVSASEVGGVVVGSGAGQSSSEDGGAGVSSTVGAAFARRPAKTPSKARTTRTRKKRCPQAASRCRAELLDVEDLHRLASVDRLLVLTGLVQRFTIGPVFLTSAICASSAWGSWPTRRRSFHVGRTVEGPRTGREGSVATATMMRFIGSSPD